MAALGSPDLESCGVLSTGSAAGMGSVEELYAVAASAALAAAVVGLHSLTQSTEMFFLGEIMSGSGKIG